MVDRLNSLYGKYKLTEMPAPVINCKHFYIELQLKLRWC